MNNNFSKFIINCKLLNNAFNIYPLLYGSLGLEVLLSKDLNSDDIDILIPEIYLKEKWDIFKDLLEANGYILIDLHEHTFVKDNVKYSYAPIESLKDFAGIDIKDITIKDNHKVLSLNQYLSVYSASIKDNYRIINKNKKDQEKIDLIKEELKKC